MLAEEKLREGNLDEALAQLQQAVRSDPSNPKYRVFLFQLLSVLGDWNRALNQLNVAAELDSATLAMAQMYREAVHCEGLRAAVFSGQRSPLVFGEPEQWIALLIESLRLSSQGQYAAAAELRDQAFELAPATSGNLTTSAEDAEPQSFEWIADADSRLGPLLEAVVNGRYYWIPFHRIRRINVEAPADLRDVVWMPAYFTWANGGETVGVIPTRYAGSESHADSRIRLSRRTEWVDHDGGLAIGLGQRMLATDAGEFPLMEIRQIVLEPSVAPAEDDAVTSPAADPPEAGN